MKRLSLSLSCLITIMTVAITKVTVTQSNESQYMKDTCILQTQVNEIAKGDEKVLFFSMGKESGRNYCSTRVL